MFCNITYVAPKGCFTETRESLFFTEEAAVDDLAKGCFCDKMLIDKELFEIGEGGQKRPKVGENGKNTERKKNFHFATFALQNVRKVGQLRMDKWCSQRLRRGRIWLVVGYWGVGGEVK